MKKLQSILILLCVIIFPLFVSAKTANPDAIEKQLRELDVTIQNATAFENKDRQRLDSLRAKALASRSSKNPRMIWSRYHTLASEYRLHHVDSSLKYAKQALIIARDNHLVDQESFSMLTIIKSLATAGLFTTATQYLDSISHTPMSRHVRLEFFITGRVLYAYMTSYVQEHSWFYDQYNRLHKQFTDSVYNLMPPENRMRRMIHGEILMRSGRYFSAKQEFEKILTEITPADHDYANCQYQLALINRVLGSEYDFASCLIKAATCDIRLNIKEGVSLPMLANWLYGHGRLYQAFRYINFSLENAMQGNARMRAVYIASLVPEIDDAFQQNINQKQNKMQWLIIIIMFLLAILLVILFMLIKNVREARRKQEFMLQHAHTRDSYIANFIALSSNYADRLDSLTQLIDRKLKAGQGAELLKIVASGKFNDARNDEFYQILDKVVLDIYPSFVEKVNALLRDDQQIELRQPYMLTPELRIYAFVRLGIEESTRIAQILHYSTATVYAYRNRMRNRAINRETFDDDVRNLDVTTQS